MEEEEEEDVEEVVAEAAAYADRAAAAAPLLAHIGHELDDLLAALKLRERQGSGFRNRLL